MIIKADILKNIKTVWVNKGKILSGIWHSWFPSQYIKKVAAHRLAICQENRCGFYDAKGESESCFIKGRGCCKGCGCNDKYKSHSLSSYCYLKDLGLTPLWDSEMTEKEEEQFRYKTGIKNEI